MRGDHGPADDGALPWGTEVLGWPDDPYRAYRLARSGGPVRRGRLCNGRPVWLVLGYAEARAALADPRRVLRRYWSQAAATGDPGLDEMSLAEHMLRTDPPDHTRLRRLVSQAFTLRRVEALRPRVAAIAATLADAMAEARSGRPGPGAGDGEVDLIDAIAFPLPIRVISELLGVPASDEPGFRRWFRAMVTVGPNDEARRASQAAALEVAGYLAELLAAKRAAPANDVVSGLVAARDDGQALTEPESSCRRCSSCSWPVTRRPSTSSGTAWRRSSATKVNWPGSGRIRRSSGRRSRSSSASTARSTTRPSGSSWSRSPWAR